MAGNSWSIMIVPGETEAKFVPDVYSPSGTPTSLQAQKNDLVCWNNQTNQEHEISIGDERITNQIAPFTSSNPGYIVTANTTPSSIEYYCSIHPEEKGTIEVIS